MSAFATNGAGIIHDFEIAMAGSTSEDVDAALGPGRFGMADETGRLLNARNLRSGVAKGMGLGQSVAAYLSETAPPFAHVSVACASARLGIPLTAHVALGTDIIHMHPAASGAAIGEGSLRDFRYFASNVAKLDHGVYLNCGSAVVLPEVFLKAVALARNRGIALAGLTTVNLDFMRLYRPQTNVVVRPPAGTGGKGYSLVGHHEILIPCSPRRSSRGWDGFGIRDSDSSVTLSHVSRRQHFPCRRTVAGATDAAGRRQELQVEPSRRYSATTRGVAWFDSTTGPLCRASHSAARTWSSHENCFRAYCVNGTSVRRVGVARSRRASGEALRSRGSRTPSAKTRLVGEKSRTYAMRA